MIQFRQYFLFYLESTNIKDNDTINKDILIDIHVHIYTCRIYH